MPVSNPRHSACKAGNSNAAHFQSMRSTLPQPGAPGWIRSASTSTSAAKRGAAAGFGASDQANGRPLQGQPRPLRMRHTDTGPIAATTRPPAPISHQKVSGSWNWRRIPRRRTSHSASHCARQPELRRRARLSRAAPSVIAWTKVRRRVAGCRRTSAATKSTHSPPAP